MGIRAAAAAGAATGAASRAIGTVAIGAAIAIEDGRVTIELGTMIGLVARMDAARATEAVTPGRAMIDRAMIDRASMIGLVSTTSADHATRTGLAMAGATGSHNEAHPVTDRAVRGVTTAATIDRASSTEGDRNHGSSADGTSRIDRTSASSVRNAHSATNATSVTSARTDVHGTNRMSTTDANQSCSRMTRS